MKKCNGKDVVFQGDIMIVPIDEIPKDAKEIQTSDEYHVVAHSETGHHHVLDATKTRVFTVASAMYLYFQALEQVELLHQRSVDGHETLLLPPRNYQLIRQREGAPEGWRQVAD